MAEEPTGYSPYNVYEVCKSSVGIAGTRECMHRQGFTDKYIDSMLKELGLEPLPYPLPWYEEDFIGIKKKYWIIGGIGVASLVAYALGRRRS